MAEDKEDFASGENFLALMEFAEKTNMIIDKVTGFLPDLKKLESLEAKKLNLGKDEMLTYQGLITDKKLFIYMVVGKKVSVMENGKERFEMHIIRQLKRWDLLDLIKNIQQYLPKP